jgi:hypothetical protein
MVVTPGHRRHRNQQRQPRQGRQRGRRRCHGAAASRAPRRRLRDECVLMAVVVNARLRTRPAVGSSSGSSSSSSSGCGGSGGRRGCTVEESALAGENLTHTSFRSAKEE